MRYFVEQQVSDVCLLFEALDWVVLSRLPVPSHDDDGREIRGSLRAAYNEIEISWDPLTPSELAAFGHPGAHDTYLQAFYKELIPNQLEVSRGVESLTCDGRTEWKDLFAEFTRRHDEAYAMCQAKVAAFEAGYRHEIERAKAEVASKILSGAIPLHGFWRAGDTDLLDDTDEEVNWDTEPRVVPHEDISPSLIDWDKSMVSIHDRKVGRAKQGTFYLVTLPTAKLIEVFPRRHGEAMQLIVHNGNAFAEGDSPRPSAPSTRGRKMKADWLPDAMRSWYAAQREAGKLGSKIEADLSAAVQWSEQVGKPVSRSTCQNYLRDLLTGNASKSKS